MRVALLPPFPTLPFALPFNLSLPTSHILKLPPEKESCPCCTKAFLKCLKSAAIPYVGCSWVIIANRRVYLALWRDRPPRPPQTAQVWDIFRIDPPSCSGCPSSQVSLGWQWCWEYVIDTIYYDLFRIDDDVDGGGHTHTLVGTNLFSPASSFPQVGPVLHLDATDTASVQTVGGKVEKWFDKSTKQNHAFQTAPASQPTLQVASFQGMNTISFAAGEFLDIYLKAQSAWHLFIVGRYDPLLGVRGTFFSATGAEAPFSGFEAKIYQLTSGLLQGTSFTWVNPSEISLLDVQLPPATWGILEWSEDQERIQIGQNGYVSHMGTSPGEDSMWDPTQQTGGNQIPLRAAIGRSVWGMGGVQPWDYLDGGVAEVVLYPQVLSSGQRIQVLNVLRSKWGLGAPMPLP